WHPAACRLRDDLRPISTGIDSLGDGLATVASQGASDPGRVVRRRMRRQPANETSKKSIRLSPQFAKSPTQSHSLRFRTKTKIGPTTMNSGFAFRAIRRVAYAALAAACLIGFTQPVFAVTMSTVPVGNAGNFNDSTGFGQAFGNYRIGTYEVTNSQYVEFLNA